MKKIFIFLGAFCLSVLARGQKEVSEIPVWKSRAEASLDKSFGFVGSLQFATISTIGVVDLRMTEERYLSTSIGLNLAGKTKDFIRHGPLLGVLYDQKERKLLPSVGYIFRKEDEGSTEMFISGKFAKTKGHGKVLAEGEILFPFLKGKLGPSLEVEIAGREATENRETYTEYQANIYLGARPVINLSEKVSLSGFLGICNKYQSKTKFILPFAEQTETMFFCRVGVQLKFN